MQFNMTGSEKMLASVAKIIEAGDVVKFGSGENRSFVKNKLTGKKLYLKKEDITRM